MKEDTFTTIKGYKLLLLLVFLLLVLGLGCWFVKKRSPNTTDVRKDDVLRQLDQHKR